MLRKVLLRALIVGVLLVVAALPAMAFTPDRIGPGCTDHIDLINPKDVPVALIDCYWARLETSNALEVKADAVKAGATIKTIELTANFQYVDPTKLTLALEPPNGGMLWPWELGQGRMGPDMSWTFTGVLKDVPATDVVGLWRVWMGYCGTCINQGPTLPPACPFLNWWSMEVIYDYPCTSISGVVLNKVDNAPMAGVEVQIYRQVGANFPGNWVGKAKTDAAGSFSFSNPAAGAGPWSLVAIPPAGFSAVGVSAPLGWERGKGAISVPAGPGNTAGLKFFMAENPPFVPPHAASTFAPVADTYISGWDKPGTTHGDEGGLRIRTGGQEATLMKFDLAGASGVVYKATLMLHANFRSNGIAMKVGAYKLLADWTEDAVWGDANFDPVVTGTGKVGGIINVDVTTLVQGWLADPATNYGVYLAGIANGSTEVTVDSSESIWEAFQPVLVVEWE